MAGTVRWAADIDATVLRALELRAHREGEKAAAVAEALLRRALAAELDELSGTVPLATVIQTAVRLQARGVSRGTGRPLLTPATVTGSPC
jgi:hypothetical protein